MHSSNLKWYAVISLLALILGFLIYLSINSQSSVKRAGTSSPDSVSENFSLFDSVTASLTGKITKVENGKIFFENQNGEKGEASISEGISISDMSRNDVLPSSDLKTIALNRSASINLSIKDGKYSVTSIIYPQP